MSVSEKGLERAHDLLGKGQTGTDSAVDGPAGHVLAAEDYASALRAQDTGEDAHQGGLAGAVGADEAEQLALVHFQRDVLYGDHSAESQGDVLGAEQGHRPDLAVSLRASSATPPGAKRMVANTSTP